MVLESTVICVDSSDYMRNGDFLPSRLHAQLEAANLICNSKVRSNPENNVALLSLGEPVQVLATLTTDTRKVMAKLQEVKPNGNISFISGVKIAHLLLRHRQGRNHRIRIVVFVGSPLVEEEKEMIQLAKKLKKEKVAVDVINFGMEQEGNDEILKAFIEEVRGKDGMGCHLVTIVGGSDLAEALSRSPIVRGEDSVGPAPAGSVGGLDFGMDPMDDPELAMALRVSMEEHRLLQERTGVAQSVDGAGSEQGITTNEENMLVQALTGSGGPPADAEAEFPDFAHMTEDEQIAYAVQMSMRDNEDEESEVQVPDVRVREDAGDDGAMNVDVEEAKEQDEKE